MIPTPEESKMHQYLARRESKGAAGEHINRTIDEWPKFRDYLESDMGGWLLDEILENRAASLSARVDAATAGRS